MAGRVDILLLITILPFHVISSERSGLIKTQRPVDSEDPIVKVEQGLLRGELVDSAAGGSFYSFKGIPYAQPPLGPLKFKDAEPPQAWEGVRNASSHGDICPQPLINRTGFAGAEDCLYLNVYTPRLLGSVRTKLPVMFWIHGGGHWFGSGNSEIYGPDYLVSENVVLVTINYRLGALGFIYLGEAAPGNVGMKDQVAALRWVKRNIAAFGGDPEKVTIFGESSGASSVSLLMLSPMTKGLFRGAIGQSGHAVAGWGQWHNATARHQLSSRLAEAVGCGDAEVRSFPSSSSSASPSSSPFAPSSTPSHSTSSLLNGANVLNCLRGVNASTLVATTLTLVNDTEQLLPFQFLPTIDMEVPGVARFLPASPVELIMRGHVHPVPYIIGFNEIEAYDIFSLYNLYDENVVNRIEESWDTLILPLLRGPTNATLNDDMEQDLRNFFMQGQPITNDTVLGFLDMLSDILVGEGSFFTLRYMARKHKTPLFQYIFTVDDAFNVQKLFSPINFTGATHADDLGYLFRIYSLPDLPSNSSAVIARARMTRLWTNFAKYGVPTSTPDSLLGVSWQPYTERVTNFLEIGPTLRLARDLNSERVAFWEHFYSKYSTRRAIKQK